MAHKFVYKAQIQCIELKKTCRLRITSNWATIS